MTNRRLKRRLCAVAIFIVLVLFGSFVEYWREPFSQTKYISGNATLIALLVAAYLAYVFQQRAKSVDDLRKWWNEIVEAKSTFFIYCDKTDPSEEDYFKGFYQLSRSMDTLRLIYCNVGRSSRNPKGYYPFEQVRDIIDVARSISPARRPSATHRRNAKLAVSLIFQSLRHAIQAEAGASPPDDPTLYESEYRAVYLDEIKNNIGIDVSKIREGNKKEDYVSRREKSFHMDKVV